MKTKIVLYSVVSVIIIAVFIYFKNIFGWLEFRSNNYTKKEFKSLVEVSKKEYSEDSLILVSIIRARINSHKEPYNNAIIINGNKAFINDTLNRIYIDSIFYSPNFNKIAFLVIIENDNKKLYKGITKNEAYNLERQGNLPYEGSHFDGTSFIAKKNNKNFDVCSYGHSFINSKTYKENSTLLREACLNHVVKNNKKQCIYNFDDIRFWSCEDWNILLPNK
ncbi:hypothetical protein [Flavobacterium sp. ENC]|uniref:hypothetical protein n=1 Tax=Flavobacterium sp. ENC TaxID=2897330 RepID=UPI001E3A2CF4|nr:hypothetical protein [Flavobacterium sp. ENC]MCD0465040.1 hypothetical protein [Flavobacterium sp. ENC]